ncbi:hypothetical protein [Parvularcula oceani]|uniref:hypothetical protein n=1 Tax=Parvularcula oceani TaxID=1247963 RepID=UPI0012DD343A|nr:hypothetical protein [Parvularcula oceani]
MFPLPQMKDRSVRVLGLGPAGRAAADALAESGARVTVWDDDAARREGVRHPAKGPRASLEGLDGIVLCDGGVAGIAKALLPQAKAARIPVLTDLDLFSAAIEALPEDARPKVIGVTGAAGKSVTTSLIAHVLRANKGKPILGGSDVPCLALPMAGPEATYVMELPVSRLSAARKFRCDISVMLGLGTCGERQGLDTALRAVMRVFRHHAPGDAAVIGVDDGLGQKICTALQSGDAAKVGAARVIPVSGEASLGHGVFALSGLAYSSQHGKTQPLGDFSRATALAGPHLNQDAAAAIAACLTLDVAPPLIMRALYSYQGLPGRFETIGSEGRILYIDDSRSRCARSVEMALAGCSEVFWIGSREVAAKVLGQAPSLRGAYVVGSGKAIRGASLHSDLPSALGAARREARAYADATPGAAPVILYSPGCASDPAEFRKLIGEGSETRQAQHG